MSFIHLHNIWGCFFMVNMVQKKVENHLSDGELETLIKSKKKDCKMFQKLTFIRAVKNGQKVSDACDFLRISEPTGHRWLDKYNEEGLTGLEPKYNKGGRPSRLSEEQKGELCTILENEDDNITIQKAHKIIKDRYAVDYSLRQVKRIIDELDSNCEKPY